MKDSVHHLKQVQKKIIRSARQSQLLEESSPKKEEQRSATYLLEPSEQIKRRHLKNQLRKSFVRTNVR